LSGPAGLRCLNLFSGFYGTTEVVPSHESCFTAVSPPNLFRKNAKKGWGTPLGWYDVQNGNLRYEAYGIGGKEHEIRGSSDDARMGRARFVLCVRNEGYPAGLELRKVYQVLADERGPKRHLLRVIDESGEDYLYPEEGFVFVG
jgi:hypothetical protein